jgi:hypothetical protein
MVVPASLLVVVSLTFEMNEAIWFCFLYDYSREGSQAEAEAEAITYTSK